MAYTNIDRIYSKPQKQNVQYLKERIDYVTNNEKTNDGELISSFGCCPSIAHFEWEFTRQLYHSKKNNSLPPDEEELIAYRVIQSFKGYEVDFEMANKIGYELAMKLTQGNHAFIVTTHVDTGNIHNHITWNAFEKDGNSKFQNTKNSYKIVEELSNELCKENNLSIITKSNEELSKDYGTWLVIKNLLKPKTHSDLIKFAIDEVLEEKPKDFDEFLIKLKAKGFEIKETNKKNISVRAENFDRFRRLDTLKGEYTQDRIKERIKKCQKTFVHDKEKEEDIPKSNSNSHTKKSYTKGNNQNKLQIMIDTEQAIKEKGLGYHSWAKRFNTKQLIATMSFMKKHGLDTYEDLTKRINGQQKKLNEVGILTEEINQKQAKIRKQQQAIIDYSKGKKLYNEYKNTGYSKKFKAENYGELMKFEEAKKVYKELGSGGKIPTMDELKKEYANFNYEKNQAFDDYKNIEADLKIMFNARTNLATLLHKDIDENKEIDVKEKDIEQEFFQQKNRKVEEEIENRNKNKTER